MPRTKTDPVTEAQAVVDAAAVIVQQWRDEIAEADRIRDNLDQACGDLIDKPSKLGEIAAQRAAAEQRGQIATRTLAEAVERHMAARRALHGVEADVLRQDIESRQQALAEHEGGVEAIVQQLRDLTGATWQPYGRSGTDGSYVRPATMADRMRHQIAEQQQEADRLQAIASGDIDLAGLDAAAAQRAVYEAEQAAYDQLIAERRVTLNELVEELTGHGVASEVGTGGPIIGGQALDIAEFDMYQPGSADVRQALLSAGTDQRPDVDREWRQRVLTVAGGCMDRWSFAALVRWMDANPTPVRCSADYRVAYTGPEEAA